MAPIAVAAVALAVAGCSEASEDDDAAKRAFQMRVERLIAGSIEPQLEQNLGKGSTVVVDCVTGDEVLLRCDAALRRRGEAGAAMKVVYGVDCADERDPATCRWTPIG